MNSKAEDKSVKILFRFFSNVLQEWTVETLWAEVVDKDAASYKLDSIHFYASAALGDVVFAPYDEDEEVLTYSETIEYSGNSTIQVVLMNMVRQITELRSDFQQLGCESEQLNDKYFVVNVPAELDFNSVKQRLERLRRSGVIDYAESCLSNNHRI